MPALPHLDRLDYLERAIRARREAAGELMSSLAFVADIEMLVHDAEAFIDLVELMDEDHSRVKGGMDEGARARYWERIRPEIVGRIRGVLAALRELVREAVCIEPAGENVTKVRRPAVPEEYFNRLASRLEEVAGGAGRL